MSNPEMPRTYRRAEAASTVTTVATIVSLAVAFIVLLFAYLGLRWLRARHSNPKYVPSRYLKTAWRKWNPRGLTQSKGAYSDRLQDGSSGPTLHLRSDNRSARSSAHLPDLEHDAQPGPDNAAGDAGVDRNTSVRSVMTLPAYSRSVRESERVLGREGERAGIDVVIEAPETGEEEEERRDEEMESLYQIRVQRRREIAERENRRNARGQARARGDLVALQALREDSLARAELRDITANATTMIADHQSRSRERRVSSVSYADLGVARHDGTRLRGNSTDSDHRPLLDSAASISGNTNRPWITGDSLSIHRRDRSGSSAMSVMTGSDVSDAELELPPFGRAGDHFEVVAQRHSRQGSRAHTPLGTRSRASSGARPSIDTADLGAARVPLQSPPAYDGAGFEDAPPYTSPIRDRPDEFHPGFARPEHHRTYSASGAPLLPEIGRLPSIRIAEATPIEPRRPIDFPTPVREVT
ncbi:hypothetical protein LTR95_008128 [Oleoguttula sp. CCFEE 5521]